MGGGAGGRGGSNAGTEDVRWQVVKSISDGENWGCLVSKKEVK